MDIFVNGSSIYCSRHCVGMAGVDNRDVLLTILPPRPKNRVLDILLGRACCDLCGLNLEDQAAAIERGEQPAARREA
jgi:hypothetical protein